MPDGLAGPDGLVGVVAGGAGVEPAEAVDPPPPPQPESITHAAQDANKNVRNETPFIQLPVDWRRPHHSPVKSVYSSLTSRSGSLTDLRCSGRLGARARRFEGRNSRSRCGPQPTAWQLRWLRPVWLPLSSPYRLATLKVSSLSNSRWNFGFRRTLRQLLVLAVPRSGPSAPPLADAESSSRRLLHDTRLGARDSLPPRPA